MTTHRRRFLRLCGVAGVGAIAGCSDSSEEGALTPTTTETTTEQEPSFQDPIQQTKLIPDDGDSGDQFGSSVTLSSDGTTALIGAQGHEEYTGSIYVFGYVFTPRTRRMAQRESVKSSRCLGQCA
jgi:hypothetical protein